MMCQRKHCNFIWTF